MTTPQLDSANRYRIEDYPNKKPFASFLPGIAGPDGVPMWVFYVNRGQAISGFGIESKDSPIQEFQPANKAYQVTPYSGFRTFLKLERDGQTAHYEPFSAWGDDEQRVMTIGMNELELEARSQAHGLQTNVLYYTLSGQPFAGLARQVTLRNLSDTPLALEMLDGLPALIPYGVNNGLLKELGRTVEAWMEVYDHATGAPFYRLRASVIDKAEVETFQAGHFALALAGGQRLGALVDPAVVFGTDTSFVRPGGFYRQPLAELMAARQITCGRTPCAFFGHQATLGPGESLTVFSLYGHISGQEVLARHLARINQPGFFEGQRRAATKLAAVITQAVETRTSQPLFDAYVQQNFLDNILRGGWPVVWGNGDKPRVYPIYSRKHGDQERDYNAFVIAPEPYSQGEGSYRDVNQNRRDNVLFNPRVGDADIRTFMSLIQTDGYNPRVVRGSSFRLATEAIEPLLEGVDAAHQPGLRALLGKAFTPGKLLKYIHDHQVGLADDPQAFVARVMEAAEQRLEAEFFEGFWIDHWEYNLDLIESYLAVFPDRQHNLLFGAADYPFYESPVFVQPRSKKYVLAGGGPRQIGSLLEDHEKATRMRARQSMRSWTRTGYGQGEVYRATLFAKLALTVLLKFATLDPYGMGIEMEAGRPGWYDALNGLPALFGSGMAETFELKRWLGFLRGAIQANPGGSLRLPVEAGDLLTRVQRQLADYQADGNDNAYWDAVSSAREDYRARTRFGVDGAEVEISLGVLDEALAAFEEKVARGIERALALNEGLPPTYFSFTVDEYELLDECDEAGRPYLRALRFTPSPLPLFLEGPVRAFKVLPDVEAARRLHQQVKASPLFDAKLKMYKVNASLESQPHDIGRARAFPAGWLENESIWLHMEYKYLLETLKAGLHAEFYEDLQNALVPFLDPEQYGRSPLENSSFLASSAHPDPAYHGAGFVARLSGSTAEFQSMWNTMMAGERPFFLQDGALCLGLRPILPGWLFTEEGEVSFRFLGGCTVTYRNPRRADTFGGAVRQREIRLVGANGEVTRIEGEVIGAPYAEQVRSGQVTRIEIDLA